MKTLEFYGHSDDCFIAGDTEFYNGKAVIRSEVGSLIITAEYGNNGCWSIGICPYDEDMIMPLWPIAYRQSNRGYSTVLTIDVPDDAKVETYVG